MAKLGSDLLTVPQDVLATLPNTLNGVTTSPQAGLGSRATTPDGRVYRYAQAGTTTIVAGNLLQAAPAVANHQHSSVSVIAGTGTFQVVPTLGATAIVAGQYTNGYLIVDSGTNHLGYTYSIVNNSAAASSGTPTIYLGEPLVNALLTSDTVSLVANPYSAVVQMPTTITGTPVGVATVAASAAYYFWVQTRGPAGTLSDATVAAQGQGVIPSTTTAGAVTVALATGTPTYLVGNAIVAGVSARTTPVFLTLE